MAQKTPAAMVERCPHREATCSMVNQAMRKRRKRPDMTRRSIYGDGSKPCTPGEPQNSWDLWMFITLKMVLIGIDP